MRASGRRRRKRVEGLQVAVGDLKPPGPRTHIVVFVDKGCLSSCEVLATMLSSQKNVQLIGQPTGGLNTSNDEYPLSGTYQFMLTTAYVMDAAGKRHYPNFVPATMHAGDEASWLAAAESLLAR
ncbi:MAG TPA: S41 family peptidase [Tahibacter sp.]|nr:S41 family peptidase [Tahibacter sp.]